MHIEAWSFVAETVAKHGPFTSVVEFGSRDVNGSVRSLFGDADYLGIDIANGPGVDLVADASTYQAETPHDCVVCCEVLEHTPDAEAIVRAAHEAIIPGGAFILTTACPPRAPHSAIDGGPIRHGEFYRNVDWKALSSWLAIFDRAEIEEWFERGDIYAWAVKAA